VAQTRYETLQTAVRDYGAAAFQNLLRSKALGEAIIGGLHVFLGCPQECVAGVPFEGPFDPRKAYGDEAFSFHRREIIVLEPVRFGISLIVGNVEDSGSLWLRTSVSVEVSGDRFDVYVAERSVIHAPREFDGALDPILEAIYQEFLSVFEIETMKFNDARFKNGIGFLRS
jgi:hypothetical protein